VIGMALMGIGGLVAILGGMAFIGNMIPSLFSNGSPRPLYRGYRKVRRFDSAILTGRRGPLRLSGNMYP
jgi:hypothetical protein